MRLSAALVRSIRKVKQTNTLSPSKATSGRWVSGTERGGNPFDPVRSGSASGVSKTDRPCAEVSIRPDGNGLGTEEVGRGEERQTAGADPVQLLL